MTKLYYNNINDKRIKSYFNVLVMDRSISYSVVVHIGSQIYSKSIEISKEYLKDNIEIDQKLLKNQLIAQVVEHIKEEISKDLGI